MRLPLGQLGRPPELKPDCLPFPVRHPGSQRVSLSLSLFKGLQKASPQSSAFPFPLSHAGLRRGRGRGVCRSRDRQRYQFIKNSPGYDRCTCSGRTWWDPTYRSRGRRSKRRQANLPSPSRVPAGLFVLSMENLPKWRRGGAGRPDGGLLQITLFRHRGLWCKPLAQLWTRESSAGEGG